MQYKLWGGIVVAVFLVGISSARADDPPVQVELQTSGSAPVVLQVDSGTVTAGTTPEVKPADSAPSQPKSGENPGQQGGPDKNKPGEQPGKPGEGGKKPGETKPGETKPGETKPGETKPGETKPDEPPKPIQHPVKPPTPPKPEELKVRPDANGKVSFNFSGQPWPGVLEWLAQISDMNLDWQEMPGDFLNLSTQNACTVPEVRDLLNQLLLARGFTLLSRGKTLSVANVKKLDLSLVPRVDPEDLEKHQSYEFVKVSFSLEKVTAEAAAEELKPMKSPNGQLIPLKITNRLEAVDAVVNLREIYALLLSEQSPTVKQRSVKEYILNYARAEEVKEQLESLLGKEKGPAMPQMPGQGGQGMTPEMMQQIQQQQEMMARHGGGGGNPQGGQQPGGQIKPPATQAGMFFVINPRKNSILAYAPPDKMTLIDQVVETLDVPTDSQTSLQASVGRTQVYRLTGVDPETLCKTLLDIGNLHHTTKLKPDPKNKAIIVNGPLVDHMIIGELVKKLNGGERAFAVRRLHQLAADYVAGTVEYMINGDKKDKSRSNNFSPWDRFNSSGNDRTETANAFRVDADVEHNQLILWANDVELADVDNLLRNLGEIPVNEGLGKKRRVIDTAGSEEAKALLERIQRNWNSISPNAIEIKPSQPRQKTPEADSTSEPSAMQFEENTPLPLEQNEGIMAADREPQPALVKFAQLSGDSSVDRPRSKQSDLSEKAPPIIVEMTPDGRIAVTSDDPQALDLFEDLASQLAETKKDYEVIPLKNCLANSVAQNLEEYFKNDVKKQGRALPRWIEWEYGIQENSDDDKSGRLSKRRPLKFIADADTNSILVQGAEAKQMKTIRELIALYDRPLSAEAQSTRRTETIPLEYSKAESIVETVKDVYRDLLSTNDKTFSGRGERDMYRSFSMFGSGDDDKKKDQNMPKFKGLLSISPDTVSNSIILSSPKYPTYLFDQVKKLILELDQSAAPASQMKVLKLGTSMRDPDIRRMLMQALGQEPPKEDVSEKKNPSDADASSKTNHKKNSRSAPKKS